MKDKPTLDGFHPRRPNTRSEFGGMGFNAQNPPKHGQQPQVLRPSAQASIKKNTFQVPVTEAPKADTHHGLSRSELEDSLRSIDNSEVVQPTGPRKGSRGDKKAHSGHTWPTRKKIIKRSALAVLAVLLLIGGYTAFKFIAASGSVFNGDVFGLVQQKALKQDSNGRTNILIFGTSEDDEGGDHPGAYLTDSIILLSVDQTKKDVYMVGIPRDLWVTYDTSCYYGGNAGKINSLFQCYSNQGEDQPAGSVALINKVSQISGLEVQYYAHINYGVVRDSVDAVGGIDITIPDYDPSSPGIYDPNFDWKCNHQCKMVNYKDGERAHMDGEHALAFARARNAAGGYGLPGGNYDREKNQQLVLVALKDKAMSVGTLTNFVAVTKLVDAMGSNLRTNFETAEIRTLMSLGADIKPDAIYSISLNKDGEMATTTGAGPDGSSIVRPIDSLYDYSSIIKYIKKQITSEPFMKEDALAVVLNGSGVAGQGLLASNKLSDMGFNLATPANAPDGTYAKREVYARSATQYPATLKKLQSLYGNVKTTGIESFGMPPEVDFVIVVGQAE